MNLDHEFFQVSKLSEDQKKRSSPKMEHLFSLNSSGDMRSDAHQSQIIGSDADIDHTQIIGGGGASAPLASMEYGKIVFHSIPYHALAVQQNQLK